MKGARLGVDASGKPYAAGGRYGLYFRQRLGTSTGAHQHQEQQLTATPSESGAITPPLTQLVLLLIFAVVVVGLILWVCL